MDQTLFDALGSMLDHVARIGTELLGSPFSRPR